MIHSRREAASINKQLTRAIALSWFYYRSQQLLMGKYIVTIAWTYTELGAH